MGMKDKEWLKEEIEKIDVEASENFPHYEVISKNVVLYAINQLDEPEKVVVPEFVAEWIEREKHKNSKLYSAISTSLNHSIHLDNWKKWARKNRKFSEIIACAWLDGYEVEKEQRYRVEDDESPLLIKVKGKISRYNNTNYYGNIEHTYELTEQEIREYNEGYMVFAIPVEEEDE